MLPTGYTRTTLAAFMVEGVLMGTALTLEWTSASVPISEAVNEVEFELGPVGTVTDIRRLRALARREAWRQAVRATADRFRASSDGQTVDLQQVHEQAVGEYERAADDYAAASGGGDPWSVGVVQVRHADPYR